MKCRLCGQPSAGPDKLCSDCNRALRRAREGSAALRNLPTSPASRAGATAMPFAPAPITLTSALTSVPPPGWRRNVAWCAIGLVAIGVAYLVQREADRRHMPETVVVGDRSPLPLQEEPLPDAAPESRSMETLATTTQMKTVAFPASPAAPQATAAFGTAQGSSPPAAPPAATRAKSGTRSAKAKATVEPLSGLALSPTDATVNSGSGSSSETSTSQQVARANVPQPAAAPDGPQDLTVMLERCSGERFLAGVICEQKVRLQYCAGKWGQVPECSSKPRAD